MPNLKRSSRGKASKGKHRRRRRGRFGWWQAVKLAFLIERIRRRRKSRPVRSSPSVRQIALVVVSGGLAIVVIRVVSRRKSHDAGTQADTTPAETTPAETTAAETTPAETTPADTTAAETTAAETTAAETTPAETTPAETTPPETQDESRDAPSTDPTPGNDTVTVSEDPLTDRVQSEMSDRRDATPGTGPD